MQAKTLAVRRQDYAEVTDIEAKLKKLPVVQSTREDEEESLADKLARVNERNRKANLEGVRKAELLEAERRRRERKLHAAGSGVATPTDPSARLRMIPRTFNNTSRSVTPNANGTPVIAPQPAESSRPISPLPPSALASLQPSPRTDKSLEASVIESIEVDLGDF
jgi:RNA polymerase-associated protein RTF1